jgi:hypothetical protein
MAIKQYEGVKFNVHVDRGDVTGKTWDGDFRSKEVLSFGDQLRIDRIRRDLLGPGPYDSVDPEALAAASILAELQVRLTESPEWWAGGVGHSDTNLLMAVYEQVRKVRDQHADEVKKQGEEAQKKLRELESK